MKKTFLIGCSLLIFFMGLVAGHFISPAIAVQGYDFGERCFAGICAGLAIQDNNEIEVQVKYPHTVASAKAYGNWVIITVRKK